MKICGKKGDLSIQMIVLAVLALLALIVLMFIFTTKASLFNKTLSSCEQNGGSCGLDATACEQSYDGSVADFACSSGQVCCVSACAFRGGVCQQTNCAEGKELFLASCGDGNVCCKK